MRSQSDTVSRGPFEKPVHSKEHRRRVGRGLLRRRGPAAFPETRCLLEDHAPYIPWHVAMVRLTGGLERLGGLRLLVPQMRRAAAWGLVALLIAVFPANVYMATNPILQAPALPLRVSENPRK